ncbi:MAG: YcfL family protein [Verrucomicrobia bacterium]|nr:YcfL family protein [Verrucomicrobiota bacterium]
MKSTTTFLLGTALAITLLTGCKTGGASAPVNTTKFDLENRETFVLLDAATQRSVTSSGIQQRIHEDGRLEVVANVRNRENRRIQVQINCEFKDGQGFVTDETPFQTLILSENEQKSVRFISMNDTARLYTIRVRQAR